MCFLSSHNYGYQVSWSNLLTSLMTGGSGVSYARRHYELSHVNGSWMAHRVIALIEFMPLIGGAVAMVERMAYAVFGSDPLPWRGHATTSKEALAKMIKNEQKALAEHYKKGPYLFNPYLSYMRLSATELQRKKATKLKLSHHVASAQGPRPTMEDAHFYREMAKGTLVGVFDGHGGSAVSAYANDQFQKRFPRALRQADGNVRKAFELVVHRIHQKVTNTSAWNHIGSTAVVSYIDHETHQVFTATLGDSEANIYRKTVWGRFVSIPLSCVRDWLSKKDLGRLVDIYGVKEVRCWIRKVGGEAKGVRSFLKHGTNLARSIGDVAHTGTPSQPRMIHKPKVTVNQLRAGDVLILACDGLKDFASEKDIVSIVRRHATTGLFQRCFGKRPHAKLLAQQLVDHALNRMDSTRNDNVTVAVVEVA